jgi:hypothetical protein
MDETKSWWFIKPDYSLQSNLMAFGWECGKGWYPLIIELFDKLDELIRTKYPEFMVDFEISQVKEKFGGLRVYTSYGNDDIFDLIDSYAEKSFQTCESCGEPGKLTSDHGWYTTLCRACLDKRDERMGRPICNHEWEYKNIVDETRVPIFANQCKNCGIIEY